MGLVMHAPVSVLVDEQCTLVSMKPIPEGKEWKDVIGFDPFEHFLPVSVKQSYMMKV